MITRILSPVDFSSATPFALTPALSLATEYDAELILLHVLDHPYPHVGPVVQGFDIEAYYNKMEEAALRKLDGLIDEDGRRFAAIRCVVRRGSAHREVVELAKQEAIDLIVLPTHGRTGFEHALWGSTAEKVVRLAPCPVMTVSPRQERPVAFGTDRIMFATDFSGCASLALPPAVSIANRYGAELIMVHVVTLWDYEASDPEWRFPPIPPEHRDAIESTGREELDKAGDRLADEPIEVRKLLVRGFDPGLELARAAAEEEVDLIVMATHGRTGFSHLVIGSTAEKVVRHARCPVLTIREGADAEALGHDLRAAS